MKKISVFALLFLGTQGKAATMDTYRCSCTAAECNAEAEVMKIKVSSERDFIEIENSQQVFSGRPVLNYNKTTNEVRLFIHPIPAIVIAADGRVTYNQLWSCERSN